MIATCATNRANGASSCGLMALGAHMNRCTLRVLARLDER